MALRHDPPVILVIDDMPSILKMVKKRLEQWGYGALTASSGEDGLELALTESPDLILLDVLMPKMKGREVCARLKANPSTTEIPVIFLTSLGLSDHVSVGLGMGAVDYVIKPFKPDDLKERIRVCLLRDGHHKGGMYSSCP